MIYLTSDTHFNHANIIKYCNRPFVDVGAMNRELVARWNAVVTSTDTVFHLGDFALGKAGEAQQFFDALNGEKHLVIGNHDGKTTKTMAWASVRSDLILDGLHGVRGRFYLVHNPASARKTLAPITVLHGHLHGQSNLHPFVHHPHTRYIDVGVDCWDYRPVSITSFSV